MSRVWKKFLFKIFRAVAILFSGVFIIFGSIFALMFLGLSADASVIIVLSVTLFIPMLGFILYQVYTDCKEEVDRENKKIMRDLRGF